MRRLTLSLATAVLCGAGPLTFYEEAAPTTLNPLYAKTAVDHRTQELVYDRLFIRSGSGEMGSKVVRDASWSEERVTVVLIDGIHWHDGRPLVADDLCFTTEAHDAVQTPATAPYRDRVVGCEVTDTTTAVLTLDAVYPDPRAHLGFRLLPAHHLKEPKVAEDHPIRATPIGTGPYLAKRGKTEVRFAKRVNPHHDAPFDALVQVEGGDPFVQLRMLANGQVDGIIAVHPNLVSAAKKDDLPGSVWQTQFLWTLDIAPSVDEEVRAAVETALDRGRLAETLGPHGTAVASPKPNGGVPKQRLRLAMHAHLDNYSHELLSLMRMQLNEGGFQGVDVFRIPSDGDPSGFDLVINRHRVLDPAAVAPPNTIPLFTESATSLWRDMKTVEIAPYYYFTEIDRWEPAPPR